MFKALIRTLCLTLALIGGPVIAQQFPNVPDRSVIGRIGTGSSSGPSQAIPFANLALQLGVGAPSSVTLNVNHSTGVNSVSCGSVGSPCATIGYAGFLLQSQTVRSPFTGAYGAFPVIQSDCGFTESPTFIGAGMALNGLVIVQGVPGTPSSCVWNTAGINVDNDAIIDVTGFTLRTTGGSTNVFNVSKGGILASISNIYSSAVGASIFNIQTGGRATVDPGTAQISDTVSSCAPNCFSYFVQNNGGTFQFVPGQVVTVPNALTFAAFYQGNGTDAATFINTTVTFSGTGSGSGSTGLQYQLTGGALPNFNSTTFPGATAGTVAPPSYVVSQNGQTLVGLSNTNSGASAQTGYSLASQNGSGGIFTVNSNWAGSAIFTNRTYVVSTSGMSGLVIDAQGTNPIVFGVNDVQVGQIQAGLQVGTTSRDATGVINAGIGFNVAGGAGSGHFLRGNGTNFVDATAACGDLSNSGAGCTAATMTATVGGLVPTPPNNTTTFLRGDGTFAAVASADVALTNTHIFVGNASNVAADVAMSGDATMANTGAVTLASTITAGGPTGSATVAPIITYDAKGRLTTVSSATITPAVGSITGLGTGVATALGNTLNAASGLVGFNGNIGTTATGHVSLDMPLTGGTFTGTVSMNTNSLTGLATAACTGACTFQSNGSTFAGNISTGQQWLLGTTAITPASGVELTVSKNTGTPTVSPVAGTIVNLINADGSATRLGLQAFGGAGVTGVPGVLYYSAQGTAAAPTQTKSGDVLGVNFGFGYSAASSAYLTTAGAGFLMIASENYDATHGGAQLQLVSTATGGITQGVNAILWGSGGFSIAVGGGTDPGAASLSVAGQQFMPNITTSSAAQTGTVCWTTGTGKFTVDTTVGCLTSRMTAKDITERLSSKQALEIVDKLSPFSFHYRKGEGDSGQYEQFGLGAEEVTLVDERLVGRDPEGTLQGVRYQELTAVLAGAIKELKADNDNLRACQENWKCRMFGMRN